MTAAALNDRARNVSTIVFDGVCVPMVVRHSAGAATGVEHSVESVEVGYWNAEAPAVSCFLRPPFHVLADQPLPIVPVAARKAVRGLQVVDQVVEGT